MTPECVATGEGYALRGGGRVMLGPEGLVVEGRAARRELYRAIRNARAGEYGLGTLVCYVTCLTRTFPLDLEFSDRATRDAFLSALRARLAPPGSAGSG